MMRTGEELAIFAMKKELARLTKLAEKAKAEADEATNIGTELIAIHKEFSEIVRSGDVGDSIVEKLDVLKKRSARAEKIRKKPLMKLFDRESNTAIERDNLASELHMREYSISLRKGE